MPYYIEKAELRLKKKLLLAKKWKEGKNMEEKHASSQTHTYGQPAPQVSGNAAWFYAHHSAGT